MKVWFVCAVVVLVVVSVFVFLNESDIVGLAPYKSANCQRLPPTIVAVPVSQIGFPGANRDYYIILTNNNVGLTCGKSQFNLFEVNPYNGWGSSVPQIFDIPCNGCLSPTNVTSTSPIGGTNTANSISTWYKVSSPTNAVAGTYNFILFAYETGQNQAGIIQVNYII